MNHTLVLLMLLYLLHQSGRGLADIGWSVQDVGHVAREIALGLIVGVGFYLFKEFVIDSLLAVMEGQTPTFYSLFNFSLPDSDIPTVAHDLGL